MAKIDELAREAARARRSRRPAKATWRQRLGIMALAILIWLAMIELFIRLVPA
jgi:uncharacterized membrane protein